jgi:UDP-glucose 4-epimerase|tara:strand:+ start:17445 stop:18449 length:1005 start_codon:yes stop_codon:yes gene_type:complete
MKILITGSLGFVGSHLAKRYHSTGHKVVGIDNGIGGYDDNLTEVQTLRIDCCNQSALDQLFAREKFDIVIHAACTAYEGLSVVSPVLVTRNTYDATVNVLTASIKHNIKRFVYMSSMARYGKQQPPFTEDMKPAPEDPYGIAKVAAEDTVKCLCEVNNIDWSIVVPHNIYGPNQVYDDPFRNVVSIFLHRNLQGKPCIIYGDGEQKRCFSYIDDTLQIFDRIVFDTKAVGQIFNLGPDEDYISINELADLTANATGYNGLHQYMPGRPKEVKYATCSSNKIREYFNYKTEVKIKDGITQTLDYIQKRGIRKFNYSLPIEIENEHTPQTWTKKLI